MSDESVWVERKFRGNEVYYHITAGDNAAFVFSMVIRDDMGNRVLDGAECTATPPTMGNTGLESDVVGYFEYKTVESQRGVVEFKYVPNYQNTQGMNYEILVECSEEDKKIPVYITPEVPFVPRESISGGN